MLRRTVYLVFGALAIICGLGIGAWLLYNLLVERQAPFREPPRLQSFFFPVIMIGVGVSMLMKGLQRVASSPRLPQRWGLAAGGVISVCNQDPLDRLEPDYDAEGCKKILEDGWGVTDDEFLQQVRRWLTKTGHREEYVQLWREVQGVADPHWQAYLDAADNPDLLRHARSIEGPWNRDWLVGWDYCRLVNVARWAYMAGMISESMAWDWIMDAARTVQSAFSSWEELGEDFRRGHTLWSGGVAKRNIADATSWLCGDPSSAWMQLDWNTDLRE